MHIAIVGPIATADIRHLLLNSAKELPPGYSGAPLLTTLISELLARGHRVTAITTTTGLSLNWRQPMHATGANLRLTLVPMRPRVWRNNGFRVGRIVDLFSFEIKGLKHAIESAAPDVVHAHWSYEFALAAIATKVPHVVTCHDSPYVIARYFGQAPITQRLYRKMRIFMALKALRNAKRLTAVSPYLQNEVQPLASTKVSVIPNPIDVSTSFHRHISEKPPEPQIAMICNGWSARKNPKPALLAFARLRHRHPKAKLHVYGADFGSLQVAEKWATRHGAEKGVIFHGLVVHQVLLESVSNCHVLLHPSLEESCPMAVIEAMSMGIPVIGGAFSGGVPWVIGQGGQLVDVTRHELIEAALHEMLIQPDKGATFGELGRRRVMEMFCAPTVAACFEKEYFAALADQAI